MVVLSERQENRVCLSCCVGILTIAAFSTGIYFLIESASGTREEKLELYNSVVTEWETKYRSQFAAASFELQSPLGTFTLVKDESKEGTLKEDEDAKAFTPLRFVLPEGAEAIQAQNFSEASVVSFNLTASGNGGPTHEIKLGEYHAFGSSSLLISKGGQGGLSRCEGEFGGIYDQRRRLCLLFTKLSTLCVQVSFNDTVGWTLDTSKGDFGCDPRVRWKPNVFHSIVKPSDYLALDAEGEPYPTNPVSFADFELRVRSSHDPMLELRLLTEDGLSFGLTSGEMVAIGICLLIVGALLMINPILTIRKICRLRRREKEDLEQQFTSIGLGSPSPSYPPHSNQDPYDVVDEEELHNMERMAQQRVQALSLGQGAPKYGGGGRPGERYVEEEASPLEGGRDARPWWTTVAYYEGDHSHTSHKPEQSDEASSSDQGIEMTPKR